MRNPPTVDLRPWFLVLDDLEGEITSAALYGNDRPLEIDVGCGRGMFLLNAALRDPDRNWLGIELDYKEGRRAASKLHKRQLANARVLGGDVRVAFTRLVPAHGVAALHVYFPDPWWKKKHRRRRLFTDEFVGMASRVLRPGGLFHSWTDVGDYFEVIRALMDHHPDFEVLPPPAERDPESDLDYQTSFERKKRQAGETIYRGLWRRRA